MRSRTRIASVVALAGALFFGTAFQAHAVPVHLSAGHVDILDVDYAAGALTLQVLDETGSTAVERVPADVVFDVPLAAKRTNVPTTPAWSFLGTNGTAWVLPQSQVQGLLFAGWSTEGVPAGALVGDKVDFNLTSVSGPGGFSVYTTSFGAPTVLFDSGDDLPDTRSVARNTHAHANWGFDAPGTYTVIFTVTGVLASTGAPVTSGPQQFTFVVANA
ncbi:choice-of-anchor M domain-containing protein [Yinghuangia sp. ASG 101]|uniref:choice-of-anchor M domain-containing protein n=1 Tax=Yinghuangia sp. ASG 101 TaxID=2896848 RepID=UPI001E5C5E27|nr:choice-of-anchor M domain-containing protein [Yinghuangia sp. ASG 101]UGQ11040.1 choice-of-anchor M domain-containing protein [Yinghuangia sp. ASG 101]